ncbi:MAG: hypothetical protein H6814_08685 [Phycisphaeraceae bacterium]|nr:hypothetical protein [Phycisphaeraceae bacterium]
MDFLTTTLAGDFPIEKDQLLFLVGGVIAVVAILSGSACSIIKTRSRERSRSEIAAYIAEGSMTPEEGERLMKAGEDND